MFAYFVPSVMELVLFILSELCLRLTNRNSLPQKESDIIFQLEEKLHTERAKTKRLKREISDIKTKMTKMEIRNVAEKERLKFALKEVRSSLEDERSKVVTLEETVSKQTGDHQFLRNGTVPGAKLTSSTAVGACESHEKTIQVLNNKIKGLNVELEKRSKEKVRLVEKIKELSSLTKTFTCQRDRLSSTLEHVRKSLLSIFDRLSQFAQDRKGEIERISEIAVKVDDKLKENSMELANLWDSYKQQLQAFRSSLEKCIDGYQKEIRSGQQNGKIKALPADVPDAPSSQAFISIILQLYETLDQNQKSYAAALKNDRSDYSQSLDETYSDTSAANGTSVQSLDGSCPDTSPCSTLSGTSLLLPAAAETDPEGNCIGVQASTSTSSKPSTSIVKLARRMHTKMPQVPEEELIYCLNLLRWQRGSLSGLKVSEIYDSIKNILISREVSEVK